MSRIRVDRADSRFDEHGLRVIPGNDAGYVEPAITIELRIYLDPGAWVVRRAGVEYSVTSLQLRLSDGTLHITQPKGVVQRRTGVWSRSEQLLFNTVHPRDARRAWAGIPDNVQLLVRRAYTTAVADLPAFEDVLGLTS